MKLLMALLLLNVLSFPGIVAAGPPGGAKVDLARRAPSSTHGLRAAPGIINFGIQPLAVPIGVITEVMQRDRILRSALKDLGLTIRFHPFLKGDDMGLSLKQGKIDVAMAGDMPTIITASAQDILAIALAKQGFSSIVTKGHYTIAGLKGKRIGYPPISNAHYALLAALASAALQEKDVRMVPMDVNEMVEALAEKRIDAFVAWEPVPTMARKKNGDAVGIYRYLNSSYLYLSRSFVDSQPEAASLVTASLIRAFAWMKKSEDNLLLASGWDLEAGTRLLGRPLNLTAEEIAVLTMQDILSISSSPLIPETDLSENGSIRKKYDFLRRQGKIPSGVPWKKVRLSFDRSMMTRVLTSPKAYRLNSFDYDVPGSAAK